MAVRLMGAFLCLNAFGSVLMLETRMLVVNLLPALVFLYMLKYDEKRDRERFFIAMTLYGLITVSYCATLAFGEFTSTKVREYCERVNEDGNEVDQC